MRLVKLLLLSGLLASMLFGFWCDLPFITKESPLKANDTPGPRANTSLIPASGRADPAWPGGALDVEVARRAVSSLALGRVVAMPPKNRVSHGRLGVVVCGYCGGSKSSQTAGATVQQNIDARQAAQGEDGCILHVTSDYLEEKRGRRAATRRQCCNSRSVILYVHEHVLKAGREVHLCIIH